jgi:hypothetical protein
MVWVYAREVLLAAVSGFFHFVEEVFLSTLKFYVLAFGLFICL